MPIRGPDCLPFDKAERLTRKVLEMALAGDIVAMRLCLERILPPRRERPVRFKLPELQSPPDAAAAMAALAAAVADGDLTPSEAAELSKLVAAYVKALEASDFDQRLRAIEGEGRCDETLSVASSASRVPVLDRLPLKYGSLTAMGHSVVPMASA
jgi:hypothetical protein